MGNPRGPWPDHGDDGAGGRRDPVPDYPRRATTRPPADNPRRSYDPVPDYPHPRGVPAADRPRPHPTGGAAIGTRRPSGTHRRDSPVPPYPGRAGDPTGGGTGGHELLWADEHDLPPVPVTVLHGRWGDGRDLAPVSESVPAVWPGDPFWHRDDDEREPGALRRAVGGVRGWFRSSPRWLKVTTGAVAVLFLIVGVSLALRDGSPQRSAAVGATTTTLPTTTAPPSTTTTAPPSSAPALPAPTVVRTTTTAPTTTVPPTTAPTTVPPTTPTTEPLPEYRTCWEALRAGALPLEQGDPGYGPHLDDDGDGRACEWGEGQRGRPL